ncbi:MAG TPA: NUDIX hydrolase [Blastocatellia bacterium]|nr:NUDIX hydrolase [Blastocatellia bacterium]
MAVTDEADEILAGGGVVIDSRNEPVRVVLIHRPKYDDWSFPKGKAERGESMPETALREVNEETGLSCRILNKLPTVRYSYKTAKGNLKPKVVHYYLMERERGRLRAPGREADAAEWCDAGAAASKLTYQHDRELLQEALRLDLQNRGGSDG